MRFAARPLGGSQLVRDYLAGKGAAQEFYFGPPGEHASYVRKAKSLDEGGGAQRAARAASLVQPLGAAARQRLREVVEAGGYFVTTGQQPGLFGGPLYGLYKALSAERLADDLSRTTGKPVMALFWIASDDHDWDEAARACFVDGANQLHPIFLRGPAGEGKPPLARIPLGADVEPLIEQVARLFPPNDFSAEAAALARRTHSPRATMATAFAEFLGSLLEDIPLGFVHAADPEVREAALPALRAETENPGRSAEALAATAARLHQEGYALQVPLIDGALNVCLDMPEGRDRLQRAVGGFRLRRSGRELSARQVRGLLEGPDFPASANVLLRPVVESFLLPTLAYVGGPAELAYFGQLGELFRLHGLEPPVAAPRVSLLVVERKVERVLEKLGLSAAEMRDGAAMASRFAREEMPDAVREPLRGWRRAATSQAGELAAAVGALDPTLRAAVEGARNAGLSALRTLETKIARAVKRQNAIVLAQIDKARTNLWPDGKAQERVLGPLQYVMRYGPEFVRAAREAVRGASLVYIEQ